MQCCPLWDVHIVFQILLHGAGIWEKRSQAGDLQRFAVAGDADLKAALSRLADVMQRADVFYSSLGGILGYQAKCLELIQQNQDRSSGGSSPPDGAGAGVHFHMPQGPDLDGPRGREIAAAEAAKGLEALPHMAEIWPLGGSPLDLAGLNTYKPDAEKVLPCGLHPPWVVSNVEQLLRRTVAVLTVSLEDGIFASSSTV